MLLSKSHFFIITTVSLILILSTSSAGLSQNQLFETYENDDFGFTIQHPSDWEIYNADTYLSNEDRAQVKKGQVMQPWAKATADNAFNAPFTTIEGLEFDKPIVPAGLEVWVLRFNEEKYLDPNDMTVKSRTVPNFTSQEVAQGWIDYNTKQYPTSFKLVRNNETTLGAGKYPAWRVDAMAGDVDPNYHSVIYSVVGDKLYGIESSIVSLVVPEYLPTIQKMIDSFQITQAGNATGNEISSASDCEQDADAEGCDQGDGSRNGRENEDEDDRSTDEEDDNSANED